MTIRPLMATVSLLSVLAAPVVGQIADHKIPGVGSVRISEDGEQKLVNNLTGWGAEFGDNDEQIALIWEVVGGASSGLLEVYEPVPREKIDGRLPEIEFPEAENKYYSFGRSAGKSNQATDTNMDISFGRSAGKSNQATDTNMDIRASADQTIEATWRIEGGADVHSQWIPAAG